MTGRTMLAIVLATAATARADTPEELLLRHRAARESIQSMHVLVTVSIDSGDLKRPRQKRVVEWWQKGQWYRYKDHFSEILNAGQQGYFPAEQTEMASKEDRIKYFHDDPSGKKPKSYSRS
jgi:hypothetical protein